MRASSPGENRGHGEDDAGGDHGEDADAARRVQVAGVQHENPGQEEELRGEEGGQPRVASLPRALKLEEWGPKLRAVGNCGTLNMMNRHNIYGPSI